MYEVPASELGDSCTGTKPASLDGVKHLAVLESLMKPFPYLEKNLHANEEGTEALNENEINVPPELGPKRFVAELIPPVKSGTGVTVTSVSLSELAELTNLL